MIPCVRNQFHGVITHIAPGVRNSAVRIRINEREILTAVVTDDQQLYVGELAIAMVKASWVLIGKEEPTSGALRNRLAGRISGITKGPLHSEIVLDLGQGRTIRATVGNAAMPNLDEGDTAYAYFRASSVVVTSH